MSRLKKNSGEEPTNKRSQTVYCPYPIKPASAGLFVCQTFVSLRTDLALKFQGAWRPKIGVGGVDKP